ncbi:hypothetical protein BS50DRAFT_184179 [Corynespora cassiicola Philippines]|uniref:Uncharacterized protein n=1 Tax=Corynespora cassiicola Philippines TaxID=1448308 RepID=A0A2T2P6N8_CORCC|nr:hypothetical protein BS50DRAFT_184179 [Corynespora cassiicola Philippines]
MRPVVQSDYPLMPALGPKWAPGPCHFTLVGGGKRDGHRQRSGPETPRFSICGFGAGQDASGGRNSVHPASHHATMAGYIQHGLGTTTPVDGKALQSILVAPLPISMAALVRPLASPSTTVGDMGQHCLKFAITNTFVSCISETVANMAQKRCTTGEGVYSNPSPHIQAPHKHPNSRAKFPRPCISTVTEGRVSRCVRLLQ